jgi:nucleotide-binding universal stress UspA family protein
MTQEQAMKDRAASTILVGVDRTPASKAALEFALREGAVRGSAVEVVTVWTWVGVGDKLAGPETPHDARERAQRQQDEAVAEVLERLYDPPVVSRQIVEGDPAKALLRAARGADYLVVGSAHKGLVKRALLGSVSETCVRQAKCPVVVIPAEDPQLTHTTIAQQAG